MCMSAPSDPYRALLRSVGEKACVNPSQIEKLEAFGDVLLAANRKMNLTALRTREDIIVRHLVDGLGLVPAVDLRKPSTVVDVGSGAGLPGLILAVCRPNLRVTLVEASKKKVAFQERAIGELGLSNARSIWARAEDLGQDKSHREQYDVACARAVAELRVLLELTLPLLRVGGVLLAQKSVENLKSTPELLDARKALNVLGGSAALTELAWTEEELSQHVQTVSDGDSRDRFRAVIAVNKIAPTPPKYPRRPGIPKKLPIV